MVLEDVIEYESTSEGRRVTKLDQILLNGNNITMLVPGGEGPAGATDRLLPLHFHHLYTQTGFFLSSFTYTPE